MPTKTNSQKKTGKEIPEEARQHFQAARQEMRESIKLLLPEGFLEHRKAARREMLLAWRSMLDSAIQRMDEKS